MRINGTDLRAKVVGEGGNLGLTQRGRVEYALARRPPQHGLHRQLRRRQLPPTSKSTSRSCSNPLLQAAELTRGERNQLLAAHDRRGRRPRPAQQLPAEPGHQHARAAGARAPRRVPAPRSARWSAPAISTARSNSCRPTRSSPSAASAASGLTRPELSMLLAYSKIWLNNHLLASDVPEDPYLSHELERYFPDADAGALRRAIAQHRLRREIIATATTNSLVNRMGPTFVPRARKTPARSRRRSRARTRSRARSSTCATLWAQIEALDNKVPANLQYEMHVRDEPPAAPRAPTGCSRHRSRSCRSMPRWREFRDGVRQLEADIARACSPARISRASRRAASSIVEARRAGGAGDAHREPRGATMPPSTSSRSPHGHTRECCRGRARVLRGRHRASASTGCATQIEQLTVEGPWQAIARSGLRDAALRMQRRLTERVLARKDRGSAQARVSAWVAAARQGPRALAAHTRRTCAPLARATSPRCPWAWSRCASLRAEAAST